MATNSNSPVVWLSDGPRLVLADGSVVSPIVTDADGELLFVGGDQGRALFGEDADDPESIGIAFVDDPDAEEHDAVEEVLEEYDI